MASFSARLAVAIALCVVVLMAVASEGAKDPTPRKHKKFDPAESSSASKPSVHNKWGALLLRSPRQTSNERRQYYPCINCFRIGSREICTSPFCPDNYQCDRPTKRCHKKPNVRGTPTVVAEEPAEPAPAAQNN